MGDCNDHGAAGPCDPPTIVPDSLRVSVAAGPLFRDNDAAPLAACFVDQSSTLPLLVTNKPSHPAGRTDVEGRRSSMIPVVLPADAAKLDDDKGPNNRRTAQAETPHGPVAGLDPLQLLPLPEEGGSPELPLQPRPGSEQPPPGVASYSSAWQKLAREVGAAAAAATRPSLCACKKLAVAALLSVDGRDGSATQRPGRVCANRGKEADCLYRAFDDAPIVPSTTVSNKKLSLLLHMDKGEPAVRTEGEEGEEAEGKGGDGEGKRDGGPGGRCPDRIKEGGDGIKDEESSKKIWGVGEAPTTSLGKGSVVLVEVRRWLMDCVASVHCPDAALREAMSRLVPPELGQTHLSPDGDGQLIALHVAAVALLVESLATLPGVLKVEGADKAAGIFTSAQAVPPTAITPAQRPVCPQQQQQQQQQPSGRLPRQYASTSRPMPAPVPIRASEMVAPSIWDFANMGGGGPGDGNRRGRGGAAAGTGSSAQARGEAPSHAGGLGYSGTTPTDLLGTGSEGIGGTAAMMSADSVPYSTEILTDQQLPGWGNKPLGWATVPRKSRGVSLSGDRAGWGGNIGGAWADSADCSVPHVNDAGIYRQGRQQFTAPSVVSGSSSGSSSSSSSYYACQYAEAATFKRQKTDSSVALAGVPRPVGQHLQGYASLFSGDASAPSGNTFGGAMAYSTSSKLGGAGGVGGVGLADFAGDAFGAGASGVDVGSAWVDAVFDSESASSSSPFLLNDK